jgi:hypothetical protein
VKSQLSLSLYTGQGRRIPSTFFPCTGLKNQAAEIWCQKGSRTTHGKRHHLFVQQRKFEKAMTSKIKTLAALVVALAAAGN